MSKTNIYLCSFASPNLFFSKLRFSKQLDNFGYYKGYKIFSYSDLPSEAKKFIKLCKKEKDLRGYGYWIWKPLIIKEYLQSLPKNSILHYCDIGSEFNIYQETNLNLIDDLKKLCDIENMVAFDYSNPTIKDEELDYKILYEFQLTKRELFKFYNIGKESIIYNSPQYSAGSFFLKNCSSSYEFIEEWLKPFRFSKKLVDNSVSSFKQPVEFIEHRHDQSIFSILCKLNNIYTLSVYDYFEHSYYQNIPYWENLLKSPLHHKRNLRHFSLIKLYRFLKRKILP